VFAYPGRLDDQVVVIEASYLGEGDFSVIAARIWNILGGR
jgi:hypothetical protein